MVLSLVPVVMRRADVPAGVVAGRSRRVVRGFNDRFHFFHSFRLRLSIEREHVVKQAQA